MLKRPLGSGVEEVEPEASAAAIFPGNPRVFRATAEAFAGYVLMEGATGRG